MTMPKTEETTDILDSALFFRVEDEDTYVDIRIYRLEGHDHWNLEVVDAEGRATVWNDEFPTEEAALDEALETIQQEGLENFVQDEVEKPTIH